MKSTIILILLLSKVSLATMDSIDSECRIQAKETAITTYQSCVKDSRTQKIDDIRKEYQSKLQELKSYYDGELKKMSLTPKTTGDDKTSSQPEITLKKKGKSSTKSSSLPAKKTAGKSLPVRSVEPEIRTESNGFSTDDSSDSEIVTVDENAI